MTSENRNALMQAFSFAMTEANANQVHVDGTTRSYECTTTDYTEFDIYSYSYDRSVGQPMYYNNMAPMLRVAVQRRHDV